MANFSTLDLAAMAVDNDTRGWIMTALSGIACVLGASIICIDVLVRLLPGKKNFKIQDSNLFLSSSLSLSFGVMLFSSLYSMLPSAKSSLQNGGFSPKAAAWTLVGCFLGGVVGIQILSRVLHSYLPSHVVDCDHSHDEEEAMEEAHHGHAHSHHDHDEEDNHQKRRTRSHASSEYGTLALKPNGHAHNHDHEGEQTLTFQKSDPRIDENNNTHRPSLQTQISHIMSGTKPLCDKNGQCYGYSDACGTSCFKIKLTNPSLPRQSSQRTPLLSNRSSIRTRSKSPTPEPDSYFPSSSHSSPLSPTPSVHSHNPAHHHHVPTNAFLSIGLQTSIAIALHKLPEGFITYATNHANPRLGFAVFLALFVHNITEGFAMALPLYLAVGSRWKAMFWSSLLGGLSQPMGAGVAAVWFKVAGTGGGKPGEGVYGIMFAITAGIMASVALQLFSESLDMTHNRNTCMVFAFVGMGILGCSSALTA